MANLDDSASLRLPLFVTPAAADKGKHACVAQLRANSGRWRFEPSTASLALATQKSEQKPDHAFGSYIVSAINAFWTCSRFSASS